MPVEKRIMNDDKTRMIPRCLSAGCVIAAIY